MSAIAAADRERIFAIVAHIERAWNDADAVCFAQPFADDGEQVNIFGTTLRDRAEIETRHREIFQTIFRGSRNVLTIEALRLIADGAILARVGSIVEVPEGPLRGTLHTRATLVLRRTATRGWEIVTFHNTRVAE